MTAPDSNDAATHLPTEAEQRAAWEDVDFFQASGLKAWLGERMRLVLRASIVGWFYLSNLYITLACVQNPLAGTGSFSYRLLYLQAVVLAIWIGAGASALWKRMLAAALSYFYFGYFLTERGSHVQEEFVYMACFMFAVAVEAAVASVVLRAYCRQPLMRRFTLGNMLAAVAATAVAIAVWSSPIRNYLAYRGEYYEYFEYYCRNRFILNSIITLISLPAFFRHRSSRRRASLLSALLILTVLLVLAVTFFDGTLQSYQHVEVVGVVISLLLVFSSTIYVAEFALRQGGVDLVMPVDTPEENAC